MESALSKRIEAARDAAEARVIEHRRKSAALGFVVVFWPQWFPAAKSFFSDLLLAVTVNPVSLYLSWLEWSGWNWLTLPIGLLIMWRSVRRRQVHGVHYQHDFEAEYAKELAQSDQRVPRQISAKQLIVGYQRQSDELANLTSQIETLTNERDAARQAYERCSRNFAMERFDRFAESIKTAWPEMTVTIRTVQYNDWTLVQEIKALLEPRWPVEIDPSNSPPLMPSDPFKVVLATGDSDRMMRLQALLDSDDGRLLNVRVGLRKRPDYDNKRLVVEILPTVQS